MELASLVNGWILSLATTRTIPTNKKPRISADAGQSQIVGGALYVSLVHAFRHIAEREGSSAAIAFKEELLEGIRSGGVSMALLDDAATFDLVVSMIEDIDPISPESRSSD
jgi:hypothetical protein